MKTPLLFLALIGLVFAGCASSKIEHETTFVPPDATGTAVTDDKLAAVRRAGTYKEYAVGRTANESAGVMHMPHPIVVRESTETFDTTPTLRTNLPQGPDNVGYNPQKELIPVTKVKELQAEEDQRIALMTQVNQALTQRLAQIEESVKTLDDLKAKIDEMKAINDAAQEEKQQLHLKTVQQQEQLRALQNRSLIDRILNRPVIPTAQN